MNNMVLTWYFHAFSFKISCSLPASRSAIAPWHRVVEMSPSVLHQPLLLEDRQRGHRVRAAHHGSEGQALRGAQRQRGGQGHEPSQKRRHRQGADRGAQEGVQQDA